MSGYAGLAWAGVAAKLLTIITFTFLTFIILRRARLNAPIQQRLASLMASTEDAVFREDLDGNIVEWNAGAQRLYGYTPEEVMGRHSDFLDASDRAGEAQRLRGIIRHGESIPAFETERRNKAGKHIPISLSLSPIRDAGGRIVAITSVAKDLKSTRATQNRLRTIMEATPVGILLVNPQGVIEGANPVSMKLFGYGEGLIGMTVEQLIPPRWRENHTAYRQQYMEEPQTRAMGIGRDLSGLTRDGREIPVEIALTPLPSEELAMATVVDITERIRWQREIEIHASRLEQSNKELDSFAYIASHDLKSPLRGIQNLCQFIEEDLDDNAAPEVKSHLELMRGRIVRMERLLDDLLQYSRVGRSERDIRDVDIAALLDDVVETLDVPDTFEVIVTGDTSTISTCRTPLEQVFRNLIHNAIKHHGTPDGNIWISINRHDSNGHIECIVEDDGPGIEPAFREKIFRVFTTLAPRDEVEGSGIGLALVKKVVERYGGEVKVSDRPGARGVRFSFTWPIHMEGA